MQRDCSHSVLRDFRADFMNMTQKQFGARAGINPNYLSQIETGHAVLGAATALRILFTFEEEMQAAGLTLRDLLQLDEDE